MVKRWRLFNTDRDQVDIIEAEDADAALAIAAGRGLGPWVRPDSGEAQLSELDPHWITQGERKTGMSFDCPRCAHDHVIRVKWVEAENSEPLVKQTAGSDGFNDISLSPFQCLVQPPVEISMDAAELTWVEAPYVKAVVD